MSFTDCMKIWKQNNEKNGKLEEVVEYEVEQILEHDWEVINGKDVPKFFVKWKGFTVHSNSWVPQANMCKGLMLNKYTREKKKNHQWKKEDQKKAV